MLAKTLVAACAFCIFAVSQALPQFNLANQINWRTYVQGAFSQVQNFETNVFETEGQFQLYWEKKIGKLGGNLPATGVDWSREKLVAINLGIRPNTGYELYVQNVSRGNAAEIVVNFRERLPIPNVRYAQVQSSPFVVIKVQREAGRIIFKGEKVSGSIMPGGTVIFPPNQQGSCCGDNCKCCSSCGCGCQRKRGGN